ncbi:SDR family NAD(P)-dependent oxidoreductase [Geomesophilobacter sediminis]|uniref:SDR family NAD(P)-dependent oxidoreductase n=1 Tax=Geomesophilobacter sediminis TaxID=2798584 RepID=A0A8J7LWP8_9BACT|nr:SDR family NAD(P)-dependent oxidoreductase [Geomesophilobacter sediminis]MBJ6726085.1 SDR family NAD(P)-dependent oxidoreductase [Geomesophilobacter sediminis]
MARTVLITGGAGFIGSHLTDELLRHGYRVRVLDALVPQVHGTSGKRPGYLAADAELIKGDVRDAEVVRRALDGVDAVYHLAALVGVGQSMYQIENYTSVNDTGTAVVMEAVARSGSVAKVVVASSMSIYGEGLYRDGNGGLYPEVRREPEQLRRGEWELHNGSSEPLVPIPTPESKTPSLASVYALSKYVQERMALIVGASYGIPVVALRFFNVYGTRQALSNPYTGVLAIFASRLLNDHPPRIFEDGQQQRDFVSVYDVARACRLALEVEQDRARVFNIGSGESRTVLQVLERLSRLLHREELLPEITGTYRAGDIRHCFADIGSARELLGFEPQVRFEAGLAELAEWLKGQIAVDRVLEAHAELSDRGLTI